MGLDSGIQALATRVATECKALWAAVNSIQPSPPGLMAPYAGAAAPSGWLLCDGAEISRSTYSALFTAIGTAHGAGDGSTTFNIPDTRVRTLVGVGTGRALGATDGVAEGSRSANYSHSHGHTATSTAVAASAGTPAGTVVGASAGTPSGTIPNHASHTHSDTLAVSSGGAYTTAITIWIDDHAEHQHYIASSTTGAGGSHRHGINGQANAVARSWASGSNANSAPALGDYNGHAHGGNTDYESVHTHGYGNIWTALIGAVQYHGYGVNQQNVPNHGHGLTGSVGAESAALSHSFTGAALAAHGHTFSGTAMTNHNHTVSTTVTPDGSAAHPYLAVNYIIKT